MIIVELSSGFGNQIFQYAAGLALSYTTGKPLHVNSSKGDNGGHSNIDYRKYLTDQEFGEDINKDDVEKNGYVWDTGYDAYKSWNPNSRILSIPENIYLAGFFQYLPALNPIIPIVRSQIFKQFRKEIPTPTYEKACFVHVRRGDYTDPSNGMYLQGKEYYQNAMEYMESIKPVEKWMMVSNDIEWCRKQNWSSSNIIYVDEADEIIQFWKMLHWTEGAVISNSTYSWWPAMLGAHHEKSPVIYPRLWHFRSTPNLFPNSWIAL